MKRSVIACLLFSTFIIFQLSGCGNRQQKDPIPETCEETVIQQIGETVEQSDSAITETTDPVQIQRIIDSITVQRPESLGSVSLIDYSSVEIDPLNFIDVDIDDQYVTSYLMYKYEDLFYNESEGPAQIGDLIVFDYRNQDNTGENDSRFLISSDNTDYSDFIDSVIGKSKGSTFTCKVPDESAVVPEDVQETNKVQINVTIKRVLRPVDFTDELATAIDPECSSKDELVKKQIDLINSEIEGEKKYYTGYSVLQKIMDNSEIMVNDDAINWKVNQIIYCCNEEAKSQNESFASIIMENASSYEAYVQNLSNMIFNELKMQIATEAIAKKEGISITDDELKEKTGNGTYPSVDNKSVIYREFTRDKLLVEKVTRHLSGYAAFRSE